MKKTKEDKKIVLGNYGSAETKDLEFIPSGCTLLDCVLGGGWPLGRISNVVGDKSSNKTGLSVEAIANFRKKYPNGLIWYQDAEAAFDISYAQTLGLPDPEKDDKTFVIDDVRDIEDTYSLIKQATKEVRDQKTVGLYVLDTLDALIPEKKIDEMDEGYDAARRAALINSMITRLVGDIESSNMHLMVVSQIRENIGVMFGEKYKRNGGKALDFYATQILWLNVMNKLSKTIRGVKKVYGITVKALAKKNKIGLPFRECTFPVIFNYGINDYTANIEYLGDIKGGLEGLDIEGTKPIAEVKDRVIKIWNEIEQEFLPTEKKYV